MPQYFCVSCHAYQCLSCYRIVVSGKCGIPRKAVIKKFKHSRDCSITACEDQMEVQCIARYLAKVFNGKLKSKSLLCGKWPKLEFLKAWSIQRGHKMAPLHVNMEPFVKGNFEKYNSNIGCIYGCHDVLQAFSHWTHHATDGYLMVVDLQVSTLAKMGWIELL